MKGAKTESSLNRWLVLVKFSVPGANATRREVFIDYYCTATTQLSARTDEAKRISLPSMRSSWSLIRRIPQTSSPAFYSSFPRVRKQLQNSPRFGNAEKLLPEISRGPSMPWTKARGLWFGASGLRGRSNVSWLRGISFINIQDRLAGTCVELRISQNVLKVRQALTSCPSGLIRVGHLFPQTNPAMTVTAHAILHYQTRCFTFRTSASDDFGDT